MPGRRKDRRRVARTGGKMLIVTHMSGSARGQAGDGGRIERESRHTDAGARSFAHPRRGPCAPPGGIQRTVAGHD